MIAFRRSEAGLVNACLQEWGHYLGAQDGPRLVLWYVLLIGSTPVAVCVSGSPRGSTCAGESWKATCEMVRICAHPDHRDMTRVALRCWRKLAAQDFANAYGNTIVQLAAYSDSSRHPGSIYRTDGWNLFDECKRGSGGTTTREQQRVALKKLWLWPLEVPVTPRQMVLEAMGMTI